jgi:zinc protease
MEIVRNRQLATTPRAYVFDARDAGMVVTTAVLGPGRLDDVARAVRDETSRLAHERIGADELARARTIVEGDGAFDKAGLGGYARKLGWSLAVAGDPAFEATTLDRLRRLDAGDLMDVASRTFQTSNLNLAVVLPLARDREHDDRAARLLPRLRAVAASPEAPPAKVAATGPVSVSGRDLVDYLLPSGIRLLVLRDDTAPQLSVRAVWSGGLRLEDERIAGATSLLARLLPRATKTRGKEALANDLADVAGNLDGIAGVDSLGLRGDFLASQWERGLELLVDCLRNPALADEEVERERRVLLDAIRSRDDDPTETALRLFRGALFGRHPYRQDLLGTADAVAGLNHRRLLDFYRRTYHPRGLTLAVLGAVEPERIVAKVQSLFADLPIATTGGAAAGDRDVSATIAQPSHTEPVEVFQFIPKAQARIVVGYPGVTVHDPDRFALEVLAEVLGGAAGSLAVSLREQAGLTGPVEAVSREGVDPGYFAVYAGVRPDAVDSVVPALRGQLLRVVEAGVSAEDVLRGRQMLIGSRALALERRGAVAMAVALHGAFGETGRSYRRDIDELGKVTAADVARVARRIIDPRREVLAVVRPRETDHPVKVSVNETNETASGPTASMFVAPAGYNCR